MTSRALFQQIILAGAGFGALKHNATRPHMILGMGFDCQNRCRRSPFLFASFSFVPSCGYVDRCALSLLAFPISLYGMMGREAELSATMGLEKPVPKIPPASLPTWLPSKPIHHRNPHPPNQPTWRTSARRE